MLLIWSINSVVITLIGLLTHAAFPDGPSCGVYSINLSSFLPYAGAAMVRVWFLVFRVEISNYLMELSWRQQKQASTWELAAGRISRSLPIGRFLEAPSRLRICAFVRRDCIQDLRLLDAAHGREHCLAATRCAHSGCQSDGRTSFCNRAARV